MSTRQKTLILVGLFYVLTAVVNAEDSWSLWCKGSDTATYGETFSINSERLAFTAPVETDACVLVDLRNAKYSMAVLSVPTPKLDAGKEYCISFDTLVSPSTGIIVTVPEKDPAKSEQARGIYRRTSGKWTPVKVVFTCDPKFNKGVPSIFFNDKMIGNVFLIKNLRVALATDADKSFSLNNSTKSAGNKASGLWCKIQNGPKWGRTFKSPSKEFMISDSSVKVDLTNIKGLTMASAPLPIDLSKLVDDAEYKISFKVSATPASSIILNLPEEDPSGEKTDDGKSKPRGAWKNAPSNPLKASETFIYNKSVNNGEIGLFFDASKAGHSFMFTDIKFEKID